MKVKSESEVIQSCLTLRDPVDCSLPGPSVHGIFQARVLEWGAIAFSEYSLIQIVIPCSQLSFFLLTSKLIYFPIKSQGPQRLNSRSALLSTSYSLNNVFPTQEDNDYI